MTHALAVSAFQGAMLGLFVAFVGAILALGQWSKRSAADLLDWRPGRSAAADEDDVAQMLAAQNALRRRRGLPDRTEADVAADLRRTRAELDASGGWPAS